jgi:hypothetical protein
MYVVKQRRDFRGRIHVKLGRVADVVPRNRSETAAVTGHAPEAMS